MFNITTIKPGQRITVHYSSEPLWARKTNNPFLGIVQKFVSVSFTAAGASTYENQLTQRGDSLSGKLCWHTTAPHLGPCVRVHKDKGTLYLAGINHDFSPSIWLVNGQPASAIQVQEIHTWLKAGNEVDRGLDFRVWTVEKLANATID